ncbi:MAG: hypothetical protein CTY16_12820 [Methylobacter sp.]|nr:MAG: hypothetical protein CTY16_12820 [Methylobacter sp.]
MNRRALRDFALSLSITVSFSLSADPVETAPAFFGVSDGRDAVVAHDPRSAFYQDKERGWFWYEPEPIEDPEPEWPEAIPTPEAAKKPVEILQTQPQPVKPLSSEWFRVNLAKYRDTAIDEPTADNVSRYLYLQRVMLDKAERFTEQSQRVVMADALLDENSRRPIATFGANAMDELADKGVDKAVKQLAKAAGLWFFYSSTCSFCIKEAGVLKGLSHAYGFKVLPIALDGLPLPDNSYPDFTIDRGQAKKMGVETTPALFLVKPGQKGDVIQIGQGLLSGDEIVKRSLVLGYQQGWINGSDYNGTLKAKPITVDSETIQAINDADIQTPGVMAWKIKENLRAQQRSQHP